MRHFLVEWTYLDQNGQRAPYKTIIVEAEYSWQAEDYTKEWLTEAGYDRVEIQVQPHIVMGEFGVENIS